MRKWIKEHKETLTVIGALVSTLIGTTWYLSHTIHAGDAALAEKMYKNDKALAEKINANDKALSEKIYNLEKDLNNKIGCIEKELASIKTVLIMQGYRLTINAEFPEMNAE